MEIMRWSFMASLNARERNSRIQIPPRAVVIRRDVPTIISHVPTDNQSSIAFALNRRTHRREVHPQKVQERGAVPNQTFDQQTPPFPCANLLVSPAGTIVISPARRSPRRP